MFDVASGIGSQLPDINIESQHSIFTPLTRRQVLTVPAPDSHCHAAAVLSSENKPSRFELLNRTMILFDASSGSLPIDSKRTDKCGRLSLDNGL